MRSRRIRGGVSDTIQSAIAATGETRKALIERGYAQHRAWREEGAYAFGCLLAFRERGVHFDAVAGTSVGGLNGLLWVTDSLEQERAILQTAISGPRRGNAGSPMEKMDSGRGSFGRSHSVQAVGVRSSGCAEEVVRHQLRLVARSRRPRSRRAARNTGSLALSSPNGWDAIARDAAWSRVGLHPLIA